MFSHVLIRAELEARPIWDDVIIDAYELRSFIWAVFLKGNNAQLVSIIIFRNRRIFSFCFRYRAQNYRLCFTLFLLQTVRPLAKTAKFWRCANSAPRRPTEPLAASHHNTSVESKNIFFWILYWSHTKPSGSFPFQETMKPWASAPHADNLCKIWTRSAPISKSYDRNKLYIVFFKGKIFLFILFPLPKSNTKKIQQNR